MSIFSDNTGFTPVPGFNFLLRVEMAFDVPVKSVRAFTKNFEYEYIQEGGLNDYVHMRRKPISQPFTLEIERYAATDLYYDPLQNGTELMLPLLLMVSPYQGMFSGYSRRTYVFTGCTVTGKEYGALDSEKSGLMTETIKIAYRQVAVIDIPETIAAEPNDYSKLFNSELGDKHITEEDMKTPVYGRQVGDAETEVHNAVNGLLENMRSFIQLDPEEAKKNVPDKRAYKNSYGDFTGYKSADINTYREGEIDRGDADKKKEENERFYKSDYGKFDGPKSADKNTYRAGEIGAAPDANKRENFHPKYGEFKKEELSTKYITYLDGEIEKKPNANERFYLKKEEKEGKDGKKETIISLGDESYYGKEVLEQYKKAAKENPPQERYYKKGYGEFSDKKEDKSADYITYLAKESGSAPDANKRTYPKTESYYGKEIAEKYKKNAKNKPRNWPKDESYYGKDVAQKYKSSAKNNARSWPKTESYYGKATLESIAKKAKKNERKWPPTESAFGLNQMKNNNKGKK